MVIVTGGGRGIGQAVCRRFARERWNVVAIARSGEQLDQTAEQVESDGGRCTTRVADVTSVEQVQAVVDSTEKHFGRIDVLVNNAGAAVRAEVKDVTAVEFETLLRVNVAGVFYACKAVWGVMEGQGGGTIVNLSSMAAIDPFPGLATYGAAKAWVNAFTRGLADEGRAAGIRVFAVAPGSVWTDMLRSAFPKFPQEQALDPAEVADAIHALTQPAMTYASGQTLYLKK
ncbi:MAG TPA: SDR family oxidoreductase [Phycisphaerae bacterium]|nr:SDR family oxidoreductase [Phycisphaerae bacterium]